MELHKKIGRVKSLMLSILLPVALLAQQSTLLGPGSPAPKVEMKAWIKGTPVKALESGKTYVFEFWATWCGPCIEAIPHLTELAKKYPNVQFVGVGVLEPNDKKQVQTFVKEMGAKMDYTVGYSGNQDGMAASWLVPAQQTGIPASFIVKDKTIQWIGHPDDLEKPLTELEKGSFDVAAAKTKFEASMRARAAAAKLQKDLEAIGDLYEAGDKDKAKTELAKLDGIPAAKGTAEELRFKWLAFEDPSAWKKIALEKMETRDGRSNLSFFINENATKAPDLCKWTLSELTSGRYEADWYPWLNGGRMYLKLKNYDEALKCTAKSRDIILEFQKANPDVPKGNALDVIAALEEQIKKAKAG